MKVIITRDCMIRDVHHSKDTILTIDPELFNPICMKELPKPEKIKKTEEKKKGE